MCAIMYHQKYVLSNIEKASLQQWFKEQHLDWRVEVEQSCFIPYMRLRMEIFSKNSTYFPAHCNTSAQT